MKKFFSVALAAMMVVSMTACGTTSETPASTAASAEAAGTEAAETETAAVSTEAAGTEEAAEAGTEAAGEGAALKIAIVSSPSGVDDGSFNEDNYNGILSFYFPECILKPFFYLLQIHLKNQNKICLLRIEIRMIDYEHEILKFHHFLIVLNNIL